jgi:hypothetical protein
MLQPLGFHDRLGALYIFIGAETAMTLLEMYFILSSHMIFGLEWQF